MGYTQFPTPGTGYSQIPSAWVRIRGASFNTIPGVRATFAGRNFSPDNNFILPLQRYSAPNNINYVETEPSGVEKFGQGLRDLFTGDVSKLFSMLPDLGVSNFIGGIGGASLLDVSYSDLLFKASAKRIHSFGWNLVAKNAKEADSLDKIANNMQSRMYPFLIDPYTNKIKPPEMWRIEIYPNNSGASRSRFTNSSAVLDNQIQLCILQNLEVLRADQTNGPILTKDNKFLSLNISATFVEIEPVYRSWNITNVAGESKHNTLYSRSKLTSGSALPVVGNIASQAISEVGDAIDDTFYNASVDVVPGLNNII